MHPTAPSSRVTIGALAFASSLAARQVVHRSARRGSSPELPVESSTWALNGGHARPVQGRVANRVLGAGVPAAVVPAQSSSPVASADWSATRSRRPASGRPAR